MDQFDYSVVGAGSAGCVLANRLAVNLTHKVLLLEAGGEDLSPWWHIPVGYFQQTAYNGFRWSTAKCFLRLAKGRANLSVVTHAQVTSLAFDGKHDTGVN